MASGSTSVAVTPALSRKIVKGAQEPVLPVEEQVAQALLDLEAGASDLKMEVRELAISNVFEVDVGGGRVALVLYVPYRLLSRYHRVHTRLVRELEKKFSGRQVVVLGKRRILPKERKGHRLLKQKRPRSRTLTAVQEAYLEDLVYPTEIVGKRTVFRTDQSRVLHVHLDPRERPNVEHRVDAYRAVYKKITGKEVVFEFPDF